MISELQIRAQNLKSEVFSTPNFRKTYKITKIATPLLFFPVKADDLYFKNQKKWNPKRNPRSRYFVLIENSSSSFSLNFWA